ncbi:GAP family protein [Vulcanococcus sp.]|jgi:hypothetical protein|uniref:GAP family protein n=1 Tax=Vulcanococcus sp. TaxID=2856995 RepID=UPI003C0868B6
MSTAVEWTLLIHLLPLAVGAAVSPMVLVVQLLNLSSVPRSAAFVLGSSLMVLIWLLCAGWIASLLPVAHPGPDPTAAAFNAVFALVLLVLALRIAQQPLPATPKPAAPGLWMPLLSGAVLMGCNLTSLVMFLPAVQDITRSGATGLQWWLWALLLALITLIPAWLPPAVVGLSGSRGHALLLRLSSVVIPHQRGINVGISLLLGLLLGARALLKV